MIRFIAFDLDGTLVDSRRDLAESANMLLAELGSAPLPETAIVGMVGEGVRLLIERVLAAARLADDVDDAVARFQAIYGERLLVHTRPYPGVVEALPGLAARLPLAVLTNKPDAAALAVLGGLGLLSHFRWVVGGDGPFPRKPAPDGLLDVIRQAGATPDTTLVVGDSITDLRTARNAGAGICLVRYGFGFAALPDGTLDGSERLVDSIAELEGWLA